MSGYSGECLMCGWTGALVESHGAAEAEAAEHAGYCGKSKGGRDELSCSPGCVAGSTLKHGKWVPCPSCGTEEQE